MDIGIIMRCTMFPTYVELFLANLAVSGMQMQVCIGDPFLEIVSTESGFVYGYRYNHEMYNVSNLC